APASAFASAYAWRKIPHPGCLGLMNLLQLLAAAFHFSLVLALVVTALAFALVLPILSLMVVLSAAAFPFVIVVIITLAIMIIVVVIIIIVLTLPVMMAVVLTFALLDLAFLPPLFSPFIFQVFPRLRFLAVLLPPFLIAFRRLRRRRLVGGGQRNGDVDYVVVVIAFLEHGVRIANHAQNVGAGKDIGNVEPLAIEALVVNVL